LSGEDRDVPHADRASDAIVFCDVSTLRIVKANAAFSVLLGREPSDVIGRSFADLWDFSSDTPGSARDMLLADMASGVRTRIRHRNGSWVDVHLFGGEVDVDGRRTLVTFVRDARSSRPIDEGGASRPPSSSPIDDREASRPPSSSPDADPPPSGARNSSDDGRARALEALGRVAGSIAHDFNNLFSIIVACVDALERTLPQNDRQREITGEIASASERATTLIKRLVAFSRRQAVDTRAVDINAVLPGMEHTLRDLVGPEICLVLRLDARLPWVRIDAAQLEQVILDLCRHAREATAQGGDIVVATQAVTVEAASAPGELEGGCEGLPSSMRRELEAGRQALASSIHEGRPPAGEWACLSVIDRGAGMDPEVSSGVIEAAVTTKDNGNATDLGLETTRGIVTRCGGHLSIDTRPGEGTVVRVWLPAIEAAGEPLARPGNEEK
jgi:PAS domain S-box-containing protein